MKPVIVVDLKGPNGNIFSLISLVQMAMSDGDANQVNKMVKEVSKSKSYEQSLEILRKYVEIVEI